MRYFPVLFQDVRNINRVFIARYTLLGPDPRDLCLVESLRQEDLAGSYCTLETGDASDDSISLLRKVRVA